MITVVKMVFSCLALRHKTGASANNALPIKKSITTAVKPRGRSTRIKPVFVLNKWSICRYFRQLTKFCLFFTQKNTFGLYMTHRDVYSAPHYGSVAERLKAPVLKTGDPKGFQSSNLCASARLNKGLPKGSPFVFLAIGILLEYSVRIFGKKISRISCQKWRIERWRYLHFPVVNEHLTLRFVTREKLLVTAAAIVI